MEKIVVHCPTEGLWRKVQTKAMQGGHRWFDKENHVEYLAKYGSETCLNIEEQSLRYADRDCYRDWEGYKIISAAEYLNEGGKDVSEFKIGDRVECIDDDGYSHLSVGKTYTVDEASKSGSDLLIRTSSGVPRVYARRFKLAATKTQTTKENNMNTNISEVFDKTRDALLVEKHLGNQLGTTFIDGLILADKKTEVLAEAKRLEKEAEKE